MEPDVPVGVRSFQAGLLAALLLLIGGVLAGGWILIAPLYRDVALCRDQGDEARQLLEDYVVKVVGDTSLRTRTTETCKSSLGVSFTAQLSPTVQASDVEMAFVEEGCQSLGYPAGPFECSTAGTPQIFVSVHGDESPVRVSAGMALAQRSR